MYYACVPHTYTTCTCADYVNKNSTMHTDKNSLNSRNITTKPAPPPRRPVQLQTSRSQKPKPKSHLVFWYYIYRGSVHPLTHAVYVNVHVMSSSFPSTGNYGCLNPVHGHDGIIVAQLATSYFRLLSIQVLCFLPFTWAQYSKSFVKNFFPSRINQLYRPF